MLNSWHQHYYEPGLVGSVDSCARVAGVALIMVALWLYYKDVTFDVARSVYIFKQCCFGSAFDALG